MARSDRTADEVQSVAQLLATVQENLQHVAARMREEELPSILTHWDTQLRHHVPALMEWSSRLRGEVEAQISAYKLGVESRASKNKRDHETRVKKAKAARSKKAT